MSSTPIEPGINQNFSLIVRELSVRLYVLKTRERRLSIDGGGEKSERRGAKCECGMHAILANRN